MVHPCCTNDALASVSVVLPVMTETKSVQQTIRQLEGHADITQFLLVVCDRTLPESLAICQQYVEAQPDRFVLVRQTLPFLGGAIRDAFAAAAGSHVIMMASDLETDPETVGPMIAAARKEPGVIITASRWRTGGAFQGYHPIKLLANYVFQKFFAFLYGVKLTDMTYGFRIFPTALVQAIQWEELRHPFLFETLLKPLRLGVEVREIPSRWKSRDEGVSQNTFWANFAYWRVGLRLRFRAPQTFLKPA